MFVNDLPSAVCYEAKFSEAMGKIFGDIYIGGSSKPEVENKIKQNPLKALFV